MLDCLCGGDERGIENGFVLDFAGNVLGFFDNAVNRRAINALRLLADQVEYLFQPFNVVLAFAQVGLKALSCALLALSIISGSDFTICFSA